MKYINTIIFLGLMVLVAGCQKKEKSSGKQKQVRNFQHKKITKKLHYET